jgi:hypothetical protein
LGLCQQLRQLHHIAVPVAFGIRPRQQHGIVERGMVELVGEHGVALAYKRLHHAEIGHVAGGKQQRGGLADKSGELLFELMMRSKMSAYQMSSSRTDAPLLRALLQCRCKFWTSREAEVIVAAKSQVGFAVYNDVR